MPEAVHVGSGKVRELYALDDDRLRQLRAGIRLVPPGRLAEVADELLVERGLGAAGPVTGPRPVP